MSKRSVAKCLGLVISLFGVGLSQPSIVYAQCGPSDISGTVYRDFDSDGERDAFEPGVIGISVAAYDDSNTQVASASTAADGSYQLSAVSSSVRIEFSSLPSYLYSGQAGTDSFTTVAFAAPGACDQDLAVGNPAQYCQDNPDLAIACFVGGDPVAGGNLANRDTLVTVPYNFNETLTALGPSPKHIATGRETGSIWGLAYQRSSKKLFSTAFLKRHAGLGPDNQGGSNPLGAIYVTDLSDPNNPTTSNYFNLASCPGVNVGSVGTRDLPADFIIEPNSGLPVVPSFDENIFSSIATLGLGAVAMADSGDALWLTNLFDRKLYRIAIGDGASTPSCATDVTSYEIAGHGCSNNDYRPFAVTEHDGIQYVGLVCSGETDQDQSQLRAHIMMRTPVGFSSIFNFPLNYDRGYALPLAGYSALTVPNIASNNVPLNGVVAQSPTGIGGRWMPWVRSFDEIGGLTFSTAPDLAFYVWAQPILADIAFDNDGSVVLAFVDRLSHQLGKLNFLPSRSVLKLVLEGVMQGDLVRVYNVNGTYALEDNGRKPGTAAASHSGVNNGQGPNGGEKYWDDMAPLAGGAGEAHREFAAPGGIAQKPGDSVIISTQGNPLNDYASAGVSAYSHVSGARERNKRIYSETTPGAFGKTAGLGDIELLCEPAPIEIGNRVWRDDDNDGIQDPSEPPISGVTLNLYNSTGGLVATKLSDSSGNYYFDDSDGVERQQSYTICVNNNADYQAGGPLHQMNLTVFNAGDDLHNSDAAQQAVCGTLPGIVVTTRDFGDNDHTYDVGFMLLVPPTPTPTPPGTPTPSPTPDITPTPTSTPEIKCVSGNIDPCGVCDGKGESCCKEVDIRDIQGRLDGAVKVMEKISNRFLLKTIKTLRRAGYEQEAKKLVKRTADERKTQNTLQVLSWTISWTFVSNQFVCDQQSAQSVCTYSSNEPLRAEYEDGVRGIMNSASKISKQAVKFVTKAFGRSSAAAKKVRKARKKTLQRIVNMGEEHIELSLTGIPQVNASCPF